MKEIINFILKHAKPYYGAFSKIVICIVVTSAITLVSPYISGLIIDNFFNNFDFKYVLLLISIGFGLTVLSRLVRLVQERIDVQYFFFDFIKNVHMEGIEKILSFSAGQHTNKNSGVKDSIMSKGVNAIRMVVQGLVYDVLPLFLKITVLLVGLFVIDWQFGILASVALVSIIFGQMKFSQKFIPEFRVLEKLGQERHKGFWEILRNIFLIKNNGREDYAYDHVSKLYKEEHEPAKKHWTHFFNGLTSISILIPFFSSITMILAAWKIGQGNLTPGMFVVISTWTGMLFSEIFTLQYLQRMFMSNLPAIREYKEFMEQKPDIKILKNVQNIKSFNGSITFDNVSFSYPDEEGKDRVLKNISFTIQEKETIGIVGKSGSGKSTLTKLLLRNYDPGKGKILIDGHDLKRLDLSYYLQHLGYVEQSTQLFDTTIRKNLDFATSETLSEEDYRKALSQAGLLDFIEKLPNGLDTKIGEQGIKLSGGQRQRLAIARALIKKPKILILDEATASLDTEKEREIQEAIDNLAKENISATKIVIAHRLSTIVNADRIFVFDEGKIVDIGTHSELLDRCEIYQNLYNLQHQTALM